MNIDLLKVALSFVVGGCWIAATATLAEVRGSTVGGLLGGLPSTLVVALLFIGWNQGPTAAYAATHALPIAFGINALFMLGYAALGVYGLLPGLAGALGLWLSGQGILLGLGAPNYGLALAIWALLLTGAYGIMVRVLSLPPAQQTLTVRSLPQLVLRGVLAGAIVASAVLLSQIGGPVLGAIMAAFPAVYLSSLVITARSAGVAFSRALTLPLMVSGVFNCVVYASVFRLTVRGFGLLPASLAAYGVALIGGYFTYRFLRARS